MDNQRVWGALKKLYLLSSHDFALSFKDTLDAFRLS
jgi:hypothetical protein